MAASYQKKGKKKRGKKVPQKKDTHRNLTKKQRGKKGKVVNSYEDYILKFEEEENEKVKEGIKKRTGAKKRNSLRAYKAFFDGSCEPYNPGGKMGTGIVIIDEDGEVIHKNSQRFEAKDSNSNNVAEYLALKDVLTWVKENLDKNSEITIFGDSMLVINQMKGRWGISEGLYVKAAREAMEIKKGCTAKLDFEWIPREENTVADGLSKESKSLGLI